MVVEFKDLSAPERESFLTAPPPPATPPIAASFSEAEALAALDGIEPRVVTPTTPDETHRAALVEGLRLTRQHRGPFPQQFRIVDVLSCGRRFAAVLLPRQSSKTTSIEAYLIGLCVSIPGLQVGYIAATTGKAGRTHFARKIVPALEALYPDKAERPLDVKKGQGSERITFRNGSLYQVCATPEDFRGGSFDIIWIDEAGELHGDKREELLAAAGPTQDARVGIVIEQPLMIFSGTAGKSREGNALWDYLERGRAGDPMIAILEYSAGIDLVAEDVEDWDTQIAPLLLTSHPGVGTLTTLDTVRGNWAMMPRERFLAEYLGIFGSAGTTSGIINPAKWHEAELNEEPPSPPAHFALGVAVMNSQAAASIVAAWRVDGVAHILELDHREGVSWLAPEVARLAEKYSRVPIVSDDRGPVRVVMDEVRRIRSRSYLLRYGTRDIVKAAPLFQREAHTGQIRHYGQGTLTAAVLTARKRDIGGSWGFGTPNWEDITSLEAAAMALLAYDSTPARRPMTVVFAD